MVNETDALAPTGKCCSLAVKRQRGNRGRTSHPARCCKRHQPMTLVTTKGNHNMTNKENNMQVFKITNAATAKQALDAATKAVKVPAQVAAFWKSEFKPGTTVKIDGNQIHNVFWTRSKT